MLNVSNIMVIWSNFLKKNCVISNNQAIFKTSAFSFQLIVKTELEKFKLIWALEFAKTECLIHIMQWDTWRLHWIKLLKEAYKSKFRMFQTYWLMFMRKLHRSIKIKKTMNNLWLTLKNAFQQLKMLNSLTKRLFVTTKLVSFEKTWKTLKKQLWM